MSGKGTIVPTGKGATVTICINNKFAERLIAYIDSLPEGKKPEGDNQVLACMLEHELTRATTPKVAVGERPVPRWRLKQQLRRSRDALSFWEGLLGQVLLMDGEAEKTIREKMEKHKETICRLVPLLEGP